MVSSVLCRIWNMKDIFVRIYCHSRGSRTLEEVAELLKDTLDEHEYPVEIRVITERPYFHFKTNRKELTAQILEELQQAE